MNVRASEPAMQAISARYMAQIILPKGARVLEVGCGNGASTKLIMQHVDPAQLVGIDPSPVFVEMAGATCAGEPRASFATGEAAVTGQASAFFDLVIAHTVYSHLVDPREALAEARRVLRPGGSSSSSTAILQLSPSPCLRAIRCSRPQGWCCAIWCTRHTLCAGFLLSSPRRGSACSRWRHTATCRRRAPPTC
jgi:ubiquinone/menaquinone biosynthesis C-methylase UbiE